MSLTAPGTVAAASVVLSYGRALARVGQPVSPSVEGSKRDAINA